jgi:Baseplate J-like protein
MIPLSTPLDTIDFDVLLDAARTELPNLAPNWTDYNYSDPGITIVELLAWLADTQIYSLARNRNDERLAMAALLGIKAQGAVAARATLYPLVPPAQHILIPAKAKFLPHGATASRLEVIRDTDIWPVVISSILVRTAMGSTDVTGIAGEPNAVFEPFGSRAAAGSSLDIILSGVFADGPIELSLGFDLAVNSSPNVEDLGILTVEYLADGYDPQPVEVIFDDSCSLQRSGAMILKFFATLQTNRHIFRIYSAGSALHPAIHTIIPNALSLLQQATLSVAAITATGLADQKIEIEFDAHLGADEPTGDQPWALKGDMPPSVRVQEDQDYKLWNVLPKLTDFPDAGPNDKACAIVEERERGGIVVYFGNGINGQCPALDNQIEIECAITAGAQGNVASSLGWKRTGDDMLWHNSQPIVNGCDADDIAALLRKLQKRLEQERPLVTSSQIEEAALSLPLSIVPKRANIIEGWEAGRRIPIISATRTLVVTRHHPDGEGIDWYISVRRALQGQILLGERLLVIGPDWRDFRIQAKAIRAQGWSSTDVANAIQAELALRLLPEVYGRSPWPLGRSVTPLAIEGWLKHVQGVAAIEQLKITDMAGKDVSPGWYQFQRHSLPRFHAITDDIYVKAKGPSW